MNINPGRLRLGGFKTSNDFFIDAMIVLIKLTQKESKGFCLLSLDLKL